MNNEQLFTNAKNYLDLAREKLSAGELVSSLSSLAQCYANVRELMDHVLAQQREKKIDLIPWSDNSR